MWVKTVTISAALVASLLGSAPGVAGADPTEPTPSAPTPAPAGPAPGPAPKATIDADGTYAVGTDIAPGVYATAGPVGDGACFWKRIGNPDGATLDNALTKKAQTVEIAPDDKAFKTSGCQPWQLSDGSVPPPAPGLAPALAGLQLQAYMAQLNRNAANSGQPPSP